MGRISQRARAAATESFKNHPGRWVTAGMAGALVMAGVGFDVHAGHFDRFFPSASAEAGSGTKPVADNEKRSTHKQRQAAKAAELGHISCATHIKNGGHTPEISVSFTRGSMPHDASIAATVHLNGADAEYTYYGDQGDVRMAVPTTRHGTIALSAQASITAHGNEVACTPTP